MLASPAVNGYQAAPSPARRPKRAAPPDRDHDRLCRAAARSRLIHRFPRESRVTMVKQYANSLWQEDASVLDRPVNCIKLFCDIVGRALIAKEPRMMYAVMDKPHKAAVKALQDHQNKQIETMGLAQTLARVVLDGLFSFGVLKVAVTAPHDAAVSGWNLKAGEAGAWRIDPDDWVVDANCRDWSEAAFQGHRFRIPLAVAKELKYFSRRRDDLTAQQDALFNAQGDERVSAMGRNHYGTGEEMEDMVTLWEIYVPRDKMIYTYMSDGEGGDPMVCSDGKPLRSQPWIGPYCGPYHVLAYGLVPGNALPIGPVQDIFHLDEGINNIVRKLLDQAHRLKVLLPVRGPAMRDGQAVLTVSDGEAFQCENADELKEIVFGGPHQGLIALLEMLKQLLSWVAGNLDMMGGLSPQSKTLGQDKMLEQNASQGVSDKQGTTVRFVSEVGAALGWFAWMHPSKVLKTEATVPGVPEISTPQELHPYGAVNPDGTRPALRRDASWDDLDVRVDPYSLAHQTPQMRAQFLNGIITQLQPMMPLFQQAGLMLDPIFYLEKLAEYGDSPDLKQLFSQQAPPAPAPDSGGGSPPMLSGGPPPQQRTNVRLNRSEVTGPGQSKSIIQAALGQDPGGASQGAAA